MLGGEEQCTVALSTTEAEYMELAEATKKQRTTICRRDRVEFTEKYYYT